MPRAAATKAKPAAKSTTRSTSRTARAPSKPTKTAASVAQVLGSLVNQYDAAGTGRRMRGWNPPNSGPNNALKGLQNIRKRSRDSVRNDWSSASSVQHWTTNLIGVGITPRITRIKSKELKQAINDLWDDWCKVCDADGVLDFYGLQTLATRSWLESGEVFVRFRPRRSDFGMDVPMQIQLLEADMVPMLDADSYTNMPTGHKIRSGIEFDRSNQRVAYWVYREHPGDNSGNVRADQLVRVAKSQMLHVYEPKRPSQVRGVPDLAPVLARLRNVLDFDDAVLERQKLANLFALFIETGLGNGVDDGTDPLTGMPIENENDPMVGLEPGIVHKLLPGEKISFANPPEAGTDYHEYLRSQNVGVSAGGGLPYELMSGDIREIQDRTLRIVINEFRRYARQRQWQIIIPQMCQPIRNYWVDSATLVGEIALANADDAKRVTWAPEGWEYIHPTQDVEAKAKEVEAGFRSRDSVISERGDDPEQVDQERADSQKREKDLGIESVPPPGNGAPGAPAKPGSPKQPNDDEQSNVLATFNASLGRLEALVATIQAHAAAGTKEGITINNHIPPTQITATVEAPKVAVTNNVEPTPVQVNNNVDVQPTPVSVEVKNEVNPTPVDVKVDVAAPKVEVTNEVQPAEVTVNLPDRKTETSIKRDSQGNIVSTTQVEKTIQ